MGADAAGGGTGVNGLDNLDNLDNLATDELRERAFAAAEHRRDIGFFWDLLKHLRGSEDLAGDDGSAGGLGGSITGAIELVTQLLTRDDGAMEPLLRARYIDYLQTGD